jgi:hypothetical protein
VVPRLQSLAFLVCVAIATAPSSAQDRGAPVWTIRVPASDAGAPFKKWASSDDCIAVATSTTVYVVSVAGESMWSWNYRHSSRFLNDGREYSSVPIALSPSCDHLAMAGDSGYKYVWVAGWDVEAKSIQTVGTPLMTAFSLDGDFLAISTGASRGYLLTSDLESRWTGPLRDFPIRWPEQIAGDGASDERIEFRQDAVGALLGVPPWGYYVSDSVSTDGQWRVVVDSPWARQDGWQMVRFYGPEARAYHGRWEGFRRRARPRWSKPMGCASAEMTPDGQFIIVTGDVGHPDQTIYGRADSTCYQDGTQTAFVLDHTGATVMRMRMGANSTPDAWPEGFAAAFRMRTGQPLPGRPESSYSSVCEPGESGGFPPLCFPGPKGLVITSRGTQIRAIRSR